MILAQLSEIIRKGMGWCPNAQMIKTAPVVFSTPPAIVHPLEPDGGPGGSGRIGRGIQVVTESIRTLVREKQLLWFSVMTGLVIAFMFMAQYTLRVLDTYPYDMISDSLWIVLTFTIEMVSLFFIFYLLAGLVLSRPTERRGMGISIREGLLKAKAYVRPLVVWSGIISILGTGIYLLIRSSADLMMSSLMLRFPFGYIVTPEAYGIGPIPGTYFILYASYSTLLMMTINVILLVLTLFVVPVLVLERKTLYGAIGESVRLMKKSWGEMLVCFLIFGVILIAFTSLSGIFQIIFDAVSLNGPFWYEFYYKGGWGAVAAAYITAWIGLVLIGATLAGIAIRNLYRYATTGQIPGAPEGEQEVQASA
jgi:hypothetical protein